MTPAHLDMDKCMTIHLDYELPEYPAFEEGYRRAPRLRVGPLCRFATSPHTVGSHPHRGGQCGLQPCKYYTTLLQYSHAVIRISNVTHCGGRCKFTGA